MTYITSEKMPNMNETEALAKHYKAKADKSPLKDIDLSVPSESAAMPDGLEAMFPELCAKS